MSFTSQVKLELAGQTQQSYCCVTAGGRLHSGRLRHDLSQHRHISLGFRTENATVCAAPCGCLTKRQGCGPAQAVAAGRMAAGDRHFATVTRTATACCATRACAWTRRGGAVFRAQRVMRRNCCRRAYVRGAFLACGYRRSQAPLTTPNGSIRTAPAPCASSACWRKRGWQHAVRRGNVCVVIKGGDQVAELLKVIGAARASSRWKTPGPKKPQGAPTARSTATTPT